MGRAEGWQAKESGVKLDAIESVLGACLSLFVATLANYFLLPLWGLHPSPTDSMGMAVVFFLLSIAMRFPLRRLFRWIENPRSIGSGQ